MTDRTLIETLARIEAKLDLLLDDLDPPEDYPDDDLDEHELYVVDDCNWHGDENNEEIK